MGVLKVYLDKLTHLRDTDGWGKSDAYVKFHLEQDNFIFDKDYGRQKSKVINNDLDPEFDETFTFEGVKTLNNLVLHVRVLDKDIGIGTDDYLGSCTIKLEDMDITPGPAYHSQKIDDNGKGLFGKDAAIHLQFSFSEKDEAEAEE